MKERILNIFLYVGPEQIIDGFGVVVHEQNGTDAEKIAYLQSRVGRDLGQAKRFPLPDWCSVVAGKQTTRRLSLIGWTALLGMPQQMKLLEAGFQWAKAGRNPLLVVTPVENGKPRIEGVVHDGFYKGSGQ